jgi:hypothetical protein
VLLAAPQDRENAFTGRFQSRFTTVDRELVALIAVGNGSGGTDNKVPISSAMNVMPAGTPNPRRLMELTERVSVSKGLSPMVSPSGVELVAGRPHRTPASEHILNASATSMMIDGRCRA